MGDKTTESGERLGRYELIRPLGSGGMAEVWLAIEHGPSGAQKRVALKRLMPQLQHDRELVAGLMDEANIAARITHPNVVQLFELGREGETFFLAMEYLSGVSLSDIQRRARWTGKRLAPELAGLIVSQLCQGLDHAHRLVDDNGESLQIVHRDVSPQNVMVLFDGQVKLLDFGIAKARERMTPKTAAHVIKGKLSYMSPEQIAAQPVDARSDLFAAGVVFWELLAGQLVSPEEPPQLGAVVLPSELCPDIPAALEGVVVRALAASPRDRFQSAAKMSEAIDSVLERMPPASNAALAEYVGELFGDDREPGSAEQVWRLAKGGGKGPTGWALSQQGPRPAGRASQSDRLKNEHEHSHTVFEYDSTEERAGLIHESTAEQTAMMNEATERRALASQLTRERTAIRQMPDDEQTAKRATAPPGPLEVAWTAHHQESMVHGGDTERHERELVRGDDDDSQSQLVTRLRQTEASTVDSANMVAELQLAAMGMSDNIERSDRRRRDRRKLFVKVLLLIAAPAVVVASVIGMWPTSDPAASIAEISSVPPGAEVFVDGKARGLTPIVLQELTPGPHRFEVVLSGYRRWKDEIVLPANERRSVHAVLVRRE